MKKEKESKWLKKAKEDALALSNAMKKGDTVNMMGRLIPVEDVTMHECHLCKIKVKKILKDKWGSRYCEKCYYEVVDVDPDYPDYGADADRERESDRSESDHYDRMVDGGWD